MSGETIELDAADKPADVAAAYAIQTIQTAASGAAQIGWKLGATNDKRSRCSSSTMRSQDRCCRRSDPATARASKLPSPARRGSKPSFLVKLADDVPARDRPYPADEIAPAVDYVAPSFEIVGCRLPGGLANGGLVVIADGAGNIAFVEGERGDGTGARSISRPKELVVTVNGEEKARGAGSLLMWGRSARGGGLARDPSPRRGTGAAGRGRGDDRHLRGDPADRARRRGAGGLRGVGNRRSIVRLTGRPLCPLWRRLLRRGPPVPAAQEQRIGSPAGSRPFPLDAMPGPRSPTGR